MESLESLPGIESDPARVPGVEKCRKQSLLPTYSNGPSRLPGIESWKNVRSSCCFQCIQTDPADSQAFKWTQDLYFQASLGWFRRTYEFSCQLHLLSIALDSWYHWYLYP